MSPLDPERIEDEIIATSTVACLRFIAPPECKGASNRQTTFVTHDRPGVYLEGHHVSSRPNVAPSHPPRALTRAQALEVAAMLDRVGRPTGNGSGLGSGEYPRTYVEFVERWYVALANRLPRAIEKAESRRAELREIRAALTGEVVS